ncbi:hypothetical protein BPOR_0620g00060 [Botrytis porri]|uniref:Uncharacterized protein n=1 Tax=Botrytis porri TaxID=87229 RepID=A0A4Z1KDY1_9HELO|nr:hypothetical protein BPOR_0620g00060 [Botrytis porri]
MAESESDASNPLYNRDHEDYFFYGRELIPHFPYRAYHLNVLGYSLPNGRFEQDKHLSPLSAPSTPTEISTDKIVTMVYSYIIDEPSIDPAAENDIEESSFIPDPVLLSRRLNGYPHSDDEEEGEPITSYPMPITALLFKKEKRAVYAPTTGIDTQAWKIQNTKGWKDHRSTQRILERSVSNWSNSPTPWRSTRDFKLVTIVALGGLLLEHLTLRFSTTTINLKRGAMHMNMRQFITSLSEKRCGAKGCKGDICGKEYCGDHSWFPNLRNITYLNRNQHTEGIAEARCDPLRTGWSRRLIKHFQDVKLSKSIEVIFDIYGGPDELSSDDDDGESDSNWNEVLYKKYDPKEYYYKSNNTDTPVLLHNRQLAVQDCIRLLLMPNSLLKGNTNDLPEDLGLQELFEDIVV